MENNPYYEHHDAVDKQRCNWVDLYTHERCIYGRNHTIGYHKVKSEVDKTIIAEINPHRKKKVIDYLNEKF